MFHDFTIVHLSLVSCFAALGLIGLVARATAPERQLLRFTYFDIILLFAVLSIITLNRASLELIYPGLEQLKSKPNVASVMVLGYLVALSGAFGCVVGCVFGNAIVLFLRVTLRGLRRTVMPGK